MLQFKLNFFKFPDLPSNKRARHRTALMNIYGKLYITPGLIFPKAPRACVYNAKSIFLQKCLHIPANFARDIQVRSSLAMLARR